MIRKQCKRQIAKLRFNPPIKRLAERNDVCKAYSCPRMTLSPTDLVEELALDEKIYGTLRGAS